MSKLISIILPTYNDAQFLQEAIDSVIRQTYKNWELIIINDASTDSTKEILKLYSKKDPRIRSFNNRSNIGMTKNLNYGISKSRGEFIARQDGDDIWISKNKLELQMKFLNKNPDCALVGSWARVIDLNGKSLFTIKHPLTDSGIRKRILSKNCFVHSSVVLRSTALKKVFLYDCNHPYTDDYNLWLKIGKQFKFHNINKYLVAYRIKPRGITQTNKNNINLILNLIRTYKNYYPNFYLSYLLWLSRKLYLPIFETKKINTIKKYFSR